MASDTTGDDPNDLEPALPRRVTSDYLWTQTSNLGVR